MSPARNGRLQSRAVRWTVAEWRRIGRRACVEGRNRSAVIRDAVGWYCTLAESGFDTSDNFTLADLRAALEQLTKRRPAAAEATKTETEK